MDLITLLFSVNKTDSRREYHHEHGKKCDVETACFSIFLFPSVETVFERIHFTEKTKRVPGTFMLLSKRALPEKQFAMRRKHDIKKEEGLLPKL